MAQEFIQLLLAPSFFPDLNRIGKVAIPESLTDLVIKVNPIRYNQNNRIFEFLLLTPELDSGKKHGK